MSALDDDTLGFELVTDLDDLAQMRRSLLEDHGIRLELQPAERAAGLTEASIWAFERPAS